jgi:site-specific recombinase XerC
VTRSRTRATAFRARSLAGIEHVRSLLGHSRIDTTQIYTSIRPPQLKRAVSFYEQKAVQMLKQ